MAFELVDNHNHHSSLKKSARRGNNKDMHEKEVDPDTWSTQQGPPSSPHSAKFSDDQSMIVKAPPPRVFRHGLVSGNTTAGTTDEEFMTKCISNISSASSSISWAEDAVEAEMTKKMFLLWEDIQRVCTGEVEDKPDGMTTTVYEECLDWKRAFPIQELSRFSRFSEGDSTPTPTQEQDSPFLLNTSMFKSQSPDSPNPYCLTPILENHSTVDMWLSDCQSQGVFSGDNNFGRLEESIKSFTITDRPEPEEEDDDDDYDIDDSSLAQNMGIHTASKTRAFGHHNNPDPKYVPDPNNFFTSLALENVVEPAGRMSSPESYGSIKCHGDIRVQRPVSSSARGHLITPLPTKNRQLSRSFRETSSHNSQSHQQQQQPPPYYNHPHYNPYKPDSSSTNEPDNMTMSLNGNRQRTANTVKGIHGHQNPPPSSDHSHQESINSMNSSHGSAPAPHAKSRHTIGNHAPSAYGRTSSYGNKMKHPIVSSPSSTNNSSRGGRKVSESNGTSSRFSSGASSHHTHPNWSRHSSITETYSFQLTPNGTSSTKIIDNQFYETIVSTNFQSTTSASSHSNMTKLTRPDFLPTIPADRRAEEMLEHHHHHEQQQQQQQSLRAKPVRPFLYWLLDKVSPS